MTWRDGNLVGQQQASKQINLPESFSSCLLSGGQFYQFFACIGFEKTIHGKSSIMLMAKVFERNKKGGSNKKGNFLKRKLKLAKIRKKCNSTFKRSFSSVIIYTKAFSARSFIFVSIEMHKLYQFNSGKKNSCLHIETFPSFNSNRYKK